MCNALAHAQAVTAKAFAAGTVPAPYYLHLLMRAQRKQLRNGQALAPGCASPATAGGTVYVQRSTAQYKGPTAVRCNVPATLLVPTKQRTANGRTRYRAVTTYATRAVVA